MRRYGAASSDELLALGNDLATRLEAITDSDAEIAELEAETGALRVTAEGLAAAVTASRTEASALFDEAVGRVLARLGMPSARFVTEITPSGALSPSGADSVRFLFNANGGEGLQSLERIASGGGDVTRHAGPEIHRGPEYQTSDDTVRRDRHRRIGKDSRCDGENNRRTGRLHAGSQYHAPAAGGVEGETHFLVYKEASPSGNVTRIRLLDREARVGEIAKMLSGSEVTEAAVAQARALLGYGGEK